MLVLLLFLLCLLVKEPARTGECDVGVVHDGGLHQCLLRRHHHSGSSLRHFWRSSLDSPPVTPTKKGLEVSYASHNFHKSHTEKKERSSLLSWLETATPTPRSRVQLCPV